VPRFQRFADVVDLGDAQLRMLAGGVGDEPERVWAAWALALRHDERGKSLLTAAPEQEPSPGVRAHLVTLLMASGGHEKVLLLARRDPSTLVRESAWRSLARTLRRDDDALVDAVATVLATEHANVRAATLDGLQTHAAVAPVLRARTLACLDHDALDVRIAAFECLARWDGDDVLETMLGRASAETDGPLFVRLTETCLRQLGAAPVIAAVATWSEAAAVRFLELLGTRNDAITAADLRPIFERATMATDARLVALDQQRRADLPLEWLLAMAVRSSSRVTGRLGEVLAATEPAALSPEARRLVAELSKALEDAYAAECDAMDSRVPVDHALARLGEVVDDDDDWFPWVRGLELLPVLRRLMG
jgi:hypothetical protein